MKNKTLYVGCPGENLYSLLAAFISPVGSANNWPQFHDRKAIFTHQGKIAISLACSIWNIGVGDHVLAPSYSCGSELDPLVSTGATVELYQVDSKGHLVGDDLLNRISSKTKLIYITHYFGWPQNIKYLLSQLGGRNIKIIEDCALSLFSMPSSCSMGSLGDAAIYSLPKTLPVPDGGGLVLNDNLDDIIDELHSPNITDVVRKVFPLLKRCFLRRIDETLLNPLLFNILNKRMLRYVFASDAGDGEIPANYYFDMRKKGWAMSRLTHGLLNKVNINKIVSRRRRNYEYLSEVVESNVDMLPLYSNLPLGVCPLCFPVITKRRDEFCQKLIRNSIVAIPWWSGKHKLFDLKEYPDADFLKKNLLVLPIHQDLDANHMEFIFNSIRNMQ